MKYHIDTIPLFEALHVNDECPLCTLHRHLELQEIEKFLGASVMNPETRIEVNKNGFCPKHYEMLVSGNNRLGLALMLKTHIEYMKSKLLNDIFKEENTKNLSFFFKKNIEGSETAESLNQKCVVCESIEKNMKRYIDGFIILYKSDENFKKEFSSSHGLCVKHNKQIINSCNSILNAKEKKDFIELLKSLFEKNINNIENDINIFISKFDYRNTEMSWGNSKDSVERAINLLSSWCVGQEPHPDDRNKDRKF